jgi:hypothetical protein
MERSDPVADILARIMKMMDRSGASLLGSVGPFGSSPARVEASLVRPAGHADRRRRNAQPDRDLARRRFRAVESDRGASVVHDGSLSAQAQSHLVERSLQ